MKKDTWYHICYDTEGDGFRSIRSPYSYAFGKEELESAVDYAIREMGISRNQICIFELIFDKDPLLGVKLTKRMIK